MTTQYDDIPALLDGKEAASCLGFNAQYLAFLARKGNAPVPAIQIGKRWFFRKADVVAFLTGDQSA